MLERRPVRSQRLRELGASFSPSTGVRALALCFAILVLLTGVACKDSSGRNQAPSVATFNDEVPLTSAEAIAIVDAAARSIDAADLTVAVVDRQGRALIVWQRDPATTADQLNLALAVARSAAFLSSSQGPLTSRTLEYISTNHFPPTFGAVEDPEIVEQDPTITTLSPRRDTTGVSFTPQGPLWQIFSTNRGARIAGPGLTTAETGEETLFNAGMELSPPSNVDGSLPGPGLSYLPGSFPLYKDDAMGEGRRVVGGVGVYITDPVTGEPDFEAMEFAALSAIGGFEFPAEVPPEGLIFLVGILLPAFDQTIRPEGYAASATGEAAGTRATITDPDTAATATERDGIAAPEGYLIGPRADPLGNFTLAEVEQIVDNSIATADGTRAAIRLPVGTATKMVIAVTNLDGLILALFRMPDAPIFSIDVSVAKARNVVYFSGTAVDPLDQIPGIPLGTAMTNRTLGFVTQPDFPPGIDGDAEGPLFQDLAVFNQDPANFNRLARAAFRPGLQNGVVLFPGSAPLYSGSTLIGGLGVSGDGVEEDDFVTNGGMDGFAAPPGIRADRFEFQDVRLPYLKFPQLPGPGNQ